MPLYEEIANTISELIDKGTYRAGERIPSLRNLSQRMGVSINTAMGAYSRLEDQGLIEARAQSGYYVRARIADTTQFCATSERTGIAPHPVILGDVALAVMHRIAASSLVPLGSGRPNTDLLPVQKLNRMLASELRRLGMQCISYPPAQGHKRLLTQIARRSLGSGCSLSPDDIVVTSGGIEAMNLALLATCRPGDTVAIGSPVYPTFLKSIQWMGLNILEIPSNEHGISLEALDYAIRNNPVKACIAITNFNNPLGTVMPDGTKRDLVSLLGRHDIPLIEDDVYGDLSHNSTRPSAAKAYDENGLVLYCASFSKTLAPGYRVGWIVPGRFIDKVSQFKALFNISAASPTQLAIAEFLANGGYDQYLRRLGKIYARQVALVRDAVIRNFPVGTRVSNPTGGFFLWVELPEGNNAYRLYEMALREGISVAPGLIFSLSDRFNTCLRLNAAWWSEQIEQALEVVGGFAKESHLARAGSVHLPSW